jgi:hypothetical protein
VLTPPSLPRCCSRGGAPLPVGPAPGFLRGGGAAGLGARLLRVAAAMRCEIRTRDGGSEGKRELTGGELLRAPGYGGAEVGGAPASFALRLIKSRAQRAGCVAGCCCRGQALFRWGHGV